VAQVHDAEHLLVLLDDEGLLETLGERIFLAEALDTAAPTARRDDATSPGEPGLDAAGPGWRQVRAARLVRELPWDLTATASFALDCAEHALGIVTAAAPGEELLPDGSSLHEVLAQAREFLASAEGSDDRRLGALARLALARRAGKEQAKVAELAFAAVSKDEADDLDVLDDPRWANLAALSSALLACVEVLRHLALPRYVAARERSYDVDNQDVPADDEPWMTPWGPVALVGHRPHHVPAYVSAREAAERARQAVSDHGGPEAGLLEAAFQRRRLLELLGLEG
jgi:hypothetical protein